MHMLSFFVFTDDKIGQKNCKMCERSQGETPIIESGYRVGQHARRGILLRGSVIQSLKRNVTSVKASAE